MSMLEDLRLINNKIKRKVFAKKRNKELTNKKFTIISNNCWGGMIYESYNLKKQSPTVGCFFMAEDYIKFIKNMKFYLDLELKFINPRDSKYLNRLTKNKTYGLYPVGILGDLEIFFMHYKSKRKAKNEWNKRIKRINFNNIIYKFNDQNNCTKEELEEFIKLPLKNKLFFTVKDWDTKDKCIYKFNQVYNKHYINTSNEPFGHDHKFDVTKYLNEINKD